MMTKEFEEENATTELVVVTSPDVILYPEIQQPLRRPPKKQQPKDGFDSEVDGDLDSGWAWIVLTSAFMVSALLWGQVISFNVYFVALREEFGETRSKTAAVGSLNQGSVNLIAISAGIFLRKLGPRGSTMTGGLVASMGYVASFFATSVDALTISYGIVVGFGFGLCFTACLAAVSQYFKRHLAVATSVSVTGGGLGIMFFSNLLEYFRETFGWRGSLLLQGGVTLHICALGATFFPKKTKPSSRKYDDDDADGVTPVTTPDKLMTMKQRLMDARVLILMALGFIGGIALMTVLVVYKDLAYSKGLAGVFEITMTAVGIGNLLGRIVPGFILRRRDVHPIRYFIGTAVACSVVFFALAFTTDAITFVCLATIIGCGQGNFVSALPIIVAYIFGRQEMAVTYGYLLFMTGIGLLLGGPFAGFIADFTGSYLNYLVTCGSLLAFAAFLVVVLYLLHEKHIKK